MNIPIVKKLFLLVFMCLPSVLFAQGQDAAHADAIDVLAHKIAARMHDSIKRNNRRIDSLKIQAIRRGIAGNVLVSSPIQLVYASYPKDRKQARQLYFQFVRFGVAHFINLSLQGNLPDGIGVADQSRLEIIFEDSSREVISSIGSFKPDTAGNRQKKYLKPEYKLDDLALFKLQQQLVKAFKIESDHGILSFSVTADAAKKIKRVCSFAK